MYTDWSTTSLKTPQSSRLPSQSLSVWKAAKCNQLRLRRGDGPLQYEEIKRDDLEASRKENPDKSREALAFNIPPAFKRENRSPSLLLPDQKPNQEVEHPTHRIRTGERCKRLRTLLAGPPAGQTYDQETSSGIDASQRSHIHHWTKEGTWPKEYFQRNEMHHLLAKEKSTASPRRKRSEANSTASTTPSDQSSAGASPYKNPHYGTLLETLGGSYMKESHLDIIDENLCQTLLENEQSTPKDTIFRDDIFKTTCDKMQGSNEARIFKDFTPLLVPFAEPLAILSASHLKIVVESVNEGWDDSVPVTRPRPQPDYAVGFGRNAFSDDQLTKLHPFLGNPSSVSYFKATYYMHFPFLTCEVKRGSVGLDIADRQNAHSMTVAVRGVVELFRLVKREQEVHRQILGFSFSHDHESVRIWGHYPVIDGTKTTFWRYPIRKYDFTERKGKEKWTAYTFTKNVYDTWVPIHWERISSAIDDIPLDLDFELGRTSEFQISGPSGLSQQLRKQVLSEEPGERDSQSNSADLQQITPETSTQAEKPAPKRKKYVSGAGDLSR
ncbi:MAG: hypothetical protein M1837_003306 [Sclerophora amabilis]|nr:MAG: hypothetical protein M1837_003306 [Sclerophora amabilis]